MKTRSVLVGTGLFVLIAASFAAGAWAQAKVVWRWPDSMDAPVAAPKNHKILFENDHVLLLEVTIQPGETEVMHGHKWPSVFAYDAAQPALKNHELEGDKTSNAPRGYTDGQFPQCRPMDVQPPHQVTITDTFPQHFYRLEFKKMDGLGIEKMTKYPN